MRFRYLYILTLTVFITSCATIWGPSAKPGVELAEQGDHRGALDYYNTVIQSGKANADIYRRAYEEAFRLEKFNTADQYYTDAIKAGFNQDSLQSLAISLWYQRAKTAMANEHWKTAATASDKINALSNDSKAAKFCQRMVKGKALYDRGSTKQLWDAIGEFGMAANYDAKSGLPYLWMGRARHKNDRSNYDAALKEYDKALALEPDSVWSKAAREEAAKIRAIKKKMKSFWGN